LSYLSYQTGHFFSQLLTENIYQKNLKTFTKNKQENKKQTQTPPASRIFLIFTSFPLFICSFNRYLLVMGREIGNSKTLDLKGMLEDVLQAC